MFTVYQETDPLPNRRRQQPVSISDHMLRNEQTKETLCVTERLTEQDKKFQYFNKLFTE